MKINNILYHNADIGNRGFMTKDGIETAWDYCRECALFVDDGTKPCSGFPADIPCPDGQPPCQNYNFEENKAPLIED